MHKSWVIYDNVNGILGCAAEKPFGPELVLCSVFSVLVVSQAYGSTLVEESNGLKIHSGLWAM